MQKCRVLLVDNHVSIGLSLDLKRLGSTVRFCPSAPPMVNPAGSIWSLLAFSFDSTQVVKSDRHAGCDIERFNMSAQWNGKPARG